MIKRLALNFHPAATPGSKKRDAAGCQKPRRIGEFLHLFLFFPPCGFNVYP